MSVDSDFVRACALEDVPVGGVIGVDIDGVELAIVRTPDEVFAIYDECSHGQIALSEGDVDSAGCELECWLHGSRFDLRTGKPTGPPAVDPVAVYPCRVDSGDVTVDVLHPRNLTTSDITGHDTTGKS